MTFAVENLVGCQPIATTSTTQNHPLGKIVRGIDPTYGQAEFIYLVGVASTVVGDVVTYNTSAFTTTRGVAGTNLPQPVAVAMSANVASQYGWYQMSGIAVAKKTTLATIDANAAVGISGTAGAVGATSTGNEIQGCLVAASAVATTSTIQLVINRPHMMGRTAD